MKKTLPPNAVRLATIANAVLLAGGLVAYKCGAFGDWRPGPGPGPGDEQLSGSKYYRINGLIPNAATEPPPTPEPEPPDAPTLVTTPAALLGGSKSYTGFVTVTPGPLRPTPTGN